MLLFRSIIAYFRFFTRIYIPGNLDNELEVLNHGSKFLPVFGLIMGVIEAAIFYVCDLVTATSLAFIVVLFADACLTGAMHQDAFADLSDGLFSSRKQERMLEIMKDSRLGTMGTLALIFYYLMMVAIFDQYDAQLSGLAGCIVILVLNMTGKSNIAFLFYKMRYRNATHGGLGQIWADVHTSDIVIAQIITFAVLVGFYQVVGVIAYVIQILFLLLYRSFIYKKIDGFNGDTLGGVVPISNLILLFSICILRTFL